MGKKKGGKRGPPEHFTRFKLEFIESYLPTFLQCPSDTTRGELYTTFMNAFCQKYRNWLTDITVDPVEDAPDLAIFGNDDEGSAKVANEQSENFKKICKVSTHTNTIIWKLTGY